MGIWKKPENHKSLKWTTGISWKNLWLAGRLFHSFFLLSFPNIWEPKVYNRTGYLIFLITMVMHQNPSIWFFDPKNHADTWWAVSNNRPTLIKTTQTTVKKIQYLIILITFCYSFLIFLLKNKSKEPPVPVVFI
jgi:hypothetical protein